MDFSFTPEQERLRLEVREFLKQEVTDESRLDFKYDRPYCPDTWALLSKLGERRWLCPVWPEEWGGLGASALTNYVIQDELFLAFAPTPFAVIGPMVVGPTLLQYGNEEQKNEYLPRIARGEIEFSMGYTEPGSGSDLASLSLRADDKGDHYLLNGQKMFSTKADFADYGWVAVRTDPDNPFQRGRRLFEDLSGRAEMLHQTSNPDRAQSPNQIQNNKILSFVHKNLALT